MELAKGGVFTDAILDGRVLDRPMSSEIIMEKDCAGPNSIEVIRLFVALIFVYIFC